MKVCTMRKPRAALPSIAVRWSCHIVHGRSLKIDATCRRSRQGSRAEPARRLDRRSSSTRAVEEIDRGWVARYRTEDGRASVQVVTRYATSPADSVISVHVGDGVEDAYAEAQRRGDQIVHSADAGTMWRSAVLRA